MIIVGELINATRKSVRDAIESRDEKMISDLSLKQSQAGADYIDVNAGGFIENEAQYLKWIIDIILETTDIPCSIDSSNPETFEQVLIHLQDKSHNVPMINSVSIESKKLEKLMPVIAGVDLKIVALCMSDEGVPETADQKLSVADRLINELVKNDIKIENIYVDPLVQSLATNHINGFEFLKAVDEIMKRYPGVHTICGLSNISFGMPERKFLNQTLMAMAIAKGLDGAIMNPLDKQLIASIIAAEALFGKDDYGLNYLKAFRQGILKF
jgi:5-methyltetrahydrofolate--homocysteine methyltransferase